MKNFPLPSFFECPRRVCFDTISLNVDGRPISSFSRRSRNVFSSNRSGGVVIFLSKDTVPETAFPLA